MSIVTREDSILLHFGAERPETLELMRRHVSELSAVFREMGYASVDFTFGDRGTEREEPPGAEARKGPGGDEDVTPQTDPEAPRRVVAGLDMRI